MKSSFWDPQKASTAGIYRVDFSATNSQQNLTPMNLPLKLDDYVKSFFVKNAKDSILWAFARVFLTEQKFMKTDQLINEMESADLMAASLESSEADSNKLIISNI